MEFINYLVPYFTNHEIMEITKLYISKALFTDEPEDVFKAIELIENLYKLKL